MQGNLFLFIGIALFVFLIWVAAGGPLRYQTGAPIEYGFGTASSSIQEGSKVESEREAARELARIQDEVVDLQRSAVAAARFGEPSPYKDYVTLSLGTSAGNTDPDEEYVSISVSSRQDEPITMTGWKIQSGARGTALVIPEGVQTPKFGAVNETEPIILNPGDRATVVVGSSPIGMSFRENQCTGYLDQFQEFTPSLSHRCPYARDDMDRFYYGSAQTLDACRAYLSKVPRCEIPRDEPSNIGSECRSFIATHLDYNGCVDTHLGDRDFFEPTWRIYIDERSEFFTEDHDTVKLLDAQGKTVDLISY